MRITTTLAVFAAASLASTFALASSSFPPAIQTDLNAKSVPACTVCHTTPSGGSGTATQPYAVAMKQRGLLSGDVNSVKTALTKMGTDKVDSDGDGMIDVDEITVGRDPNVAESGGDGGTSGGASKVVYGCATADADGTSALGAAALALATVLVVRRRRR